jgi:NhaA family Na+:H+ antiporter
MRSRATSASPPTAVRRTIPLVDADKASAAASRAIVAPTFCINGRRYDGPWHESALSDAMPGTLGHRVRSAARFRHLGTLCGRRFRGR